MRQVKGNLCGAKREGEGVGGHKGRELLHFAKRKERGGGGERYLITGCEKHNALSRTLAPMKNKLKHFFACGFELKRKYGGTHTIMTSPFPSMVSTMMAESTEILVTSCEEMERNDIESKDFFFAAAAFLPWV